MLHGLLRLLRPDLRGLRRFRLLLGLQGHLRGGGDGPPMCGQVRHGGHGAHGAAAVQGDLGREVGVFVEMSAISGGDPRKITAFPKNRVPGRIPRRKGVEI